MRTMVERRIGTGGYPPMLLQGVFNGTELEAWRAFDVSGGEMHPMTYTLSAGQERQCERWLKEARDA